MFRVRSRIFTLAAHELHCHLEKFKAIQSNSKQFKAIQTKTSTPPPKAPVRPFVQRSLSKTASYRSHSESFGAIRSYSELFGVIRSSKDQGTPLGPTFHVSRFTFLRIPSSPRF